MDGCEMTENSDDLEVIDRAFQIGDYVAATSDPTGQIGVAVHVNVNVDLLAQDGTVIQDQSSRILRRITDFIVGDHIVLGAWLGRIQDPLNLAVKNDDDVQADELAGDSESKSSYQKPCYDIEGEHEEFISTLSGFDIIQGPLDHHFRDAQGQNNAVRKWLKKVQQDWDILLNNLPDRIDLLRAAIVGAYGTPYQDGLFIFDFHLPPEYPDIPPEGMVCLSLLNTWTGRGNEVWDPSKSSILQVLVSLQGLVLNSKPYFNEPGYEKQSGTAEGEKNSQCYNENTVILNYKTMMHRMRNPPKDFEVIVFQHFRKRGHYILKDFDAYLKGLTEDASASGSGLTYSIGMKLGLVKIAPQLFKALNEIGVDCRGFDHLMQL
ncbi:ubiquitin-conjugating enzyme 23 [Perilla frutescens var. hirtella]|nr:ubiquitin-conjugating enzyme 23 [Perilla frutescens var. hirtella]